jgi:hypothetical protein
MGLPFWRSGGRGDGGGGGGLLMAVRLSGWHWIFEFGIGVPRLMNGCVEKIADSGDREGGVHLMRDTSDEGQTLTYLNAMCCIVFNYRTMMLCSQFTARIHRLKMKKTSSLALHPHISLPTP